MVNNLFFELLNNNRSYDDVYNIVGMGKTYAGKYRINSYTESSFWLLYDEESRKNVVSLAEKPLNQSIPRLDVDVKRLYSHNKPCYTREMVVQLVKIANAIMVDNIKNIDAKKYLNCLVLEKPPRNIIINDIKYIKRGFHIHWPLFALKAEDMALWNRKIYESVSADNFFGTDNCPVDEMSTLVPWLLYSSCKQPDNTRDKPYPYKISFAVDYDLNITEDTRWLVDSIKILNKLDNSYITGPESWLMSIQPCGRKCFNFNITINNILKYEEPNIKQDERNNEHVDDHELKTLIDLLDISRAEKYHEWWQLGSVLYSITNGSKYGEELWDEFSKNCVSKYSSGEITIRWKRFKVTQYGIGMLRHWAKQDNEHAYTKYYVNKQLEKKTTTLNTDEKAEICFNIMCDKFKFTDNGRESNWWKFENNIWNKLSITSIRGFLQKNIKESLDMYLKDTAEHHKVMIKSLSEPGSISNIIKMLEPKLLDEEFEAKLDMNLDLVCFKNGVYDLAKCVFREGMPSDFISHTLACNYREFTFEDEGIKFVDQMFDVFFPRRDIKEYMINILAHVFVGNKKFKTLFIWKGKGDNGKSVFVNWILKMLGKKYSTIIPTSVLSNPKSKPGACTPELASLEGVRIAFFHEPDHTERLTNGTLKALTGRDQFFVRSLYHDGKIIQPTAIYVLVVNDIPKLQNPDDQALFNRLKLCEFSSVFVEPDKAPKTVDEQVRLSIFPKDENFAEKLAEKLDELAWYLLQRWKKIKDYPSIFTPDVVNAETRKYKESVCLLTKFISEYFEKVTPNAGSYENINIKNFCEKYNIFRNNNQKSSIMVSTVIEQLMKNDYQTDSNENVVGLTWKKVNGEPLVDRIPQRRSFGNNQSFEYEIF